VVDIERILVYVLSLSAYPSLI